MENNSEKFSYSYSGEDREKIRNIRQKYLPKQEDKMQELVRLDSIAERRATVSSLVVGILGTLVFGIGMCLCLVWNIFILGIVVGILGALLLSVAYPVYCKALIRERKKVAPEIIRLSDDLLK